MSSRSRIAMLLGAALTVTASSASATVQFTGDPTTTGGLAWGFGGNSLQATNVIWAGGSTSRSMDFFASSFHYTGTETVSTSMGNTSVGGAGWNVGDRVVAIGWTVLNGGTGGWLNGETFMKFNPGGAGTYSAATAVGGSGASTSFGNSVAGDYQLYGTANGYNESKVVSFRYRTADPGYVTTYPMQVGGSSSGALLADPFRSFSVLAGGSSAPGQALISAQTYLINVDLLSRAGTQYGFTPNMIGNTIGKLHIQVGQGAGSTPTDVVFTNLAVPAPGALALLGVAGIFGSRRRR